MIVSLDKSFLGGGILQKPFEGKENVMACEPGYCGSCIFTSADGSPWAKLKFCRIEEDPVVQQTYSETYVPGGMAGVCAKYQLNPNALED